MFVGVGHGTAPLSIPFLASAADITATATHAVGKPGYAGEVVGFAVNTLTAFTADGSNYWKIELKKGATAAGTLVTMAAINLKNAAVSITDSAGGTWSVASASTVALDWLAGTLSSKYQDLRFAATDELFVVITETGTATLAGPVRFQIKVVYGDALHTEV